MTSTAPNTIDRCSCKWLYRIAVVRAFYCSITIWSALARPASADEIKCFFTEPFLTTFYNTENGTLIVQSDGTGAKRTITTGLSLHVFKNGLLEIRDAAGLIVLHLELNSKGSDGMSETVYPFDVMWPRRNLRGGCESLHLMAKRP